MASTFMGLEIAKKGLSAHQRALMVTGHNISNADNKKYSRQRVIMTSSEPIYAPAFNRASGPGQLGQGVSITQIERIRSNFIEYRINTETNSHSYWKTKHEMLYQVEVIYNEPTGNSLRTRFDQFWSSWQELSKYPMESAVRNVLLERSKGLTSEIRYVYNKIHELRNQANILISDRVDKINNLALKIRDLNVAIRKAESLGDNPNDLYDNRDYFINELSKLVNISVSRNDEDELIVNIGSENLVQGKLLQPLDKIGNGRNEGYYDVLWEKTGTQPAILGGELKALLEFRDEILVRSLNEMDSMALNLSSLVNEIHRDGFGLNEVTNVNFFGYRPIAENIFGNFDSDGDGQIDKSAIYKVSGVNKLNPDSEIGINGTITLARANSSDERILIDYQSDDKVKDVINKINISGAGVVAYLNHNGHLSLKSKIASDHPRNNFMIRHLEDSGQFFVGLAGVLKNSGVQGSFSWNRINEVNKFQGGSIHFEITPDFHPARYMEVSETVLRNPNSIAASQGKDLGGTGDNNKSNGRGDASNALVIASIRGDKAIMVDSHASFDDFFTSMVSRVGAEARVAKDQVENKNNLLSNLNNLKESQSGVNLDEEMANMVQFQNSYNASARILATINQMLETIIRLGT